jgi:hypothetical protein
MKRIIWIGLVVAGLSAARPGHAKDHGDVTKLIDQIEIRGYIRNPGGDFFAVLKGFGLVGQGSVIEVYNAEFTAEVEIVRIAEDRIGFKIRRVLRKELPKEEPTEKGQPVDAQGKRLRDPFWPVGYNGKQTSG